MGVDVIRLIMAAMALGSALAAVAGMLWGGRFGQIADGLRAGPRGVCRLRDRRRRLDPGRHARGLSAAHSEHR
jgi:hypothetical protein